MSGARWSTLHRRGSRRRRPVTWSSWTVRCGRWLVITGCPRSTPVVPLMAEAGFVPVRVRCGVLEAQMLSSALSRRPIHSDWSRSWTHRGASRPPLADAGWAHRRCASPAWEAPRRRAPPRAAAPVDEERSGRHQTGPGPDSQTRRPECCETRSCRNTSERSACRRNMDS